MRPAARLKEKRGQGRFLTLLISLVALFVLYPVMVELGHARFFRIFFILVLIAAVFTLSRRRRHMVVALALAVPTAIGQAATLVAPSLPVQLAAVAIALLFISYVIAVVLSAVLSGGEVDGDKIAGAISVYLLLGLAWAMIYSIAALLQPGAFNGPAQMPLSGVSNPGEEFAFIYYSFVTLTTLGYGEISPVSPFARALAWMEAVTGQLYIAILVARLVALQIMHGADRDET